MSAAVYQPDKMAPHHKTQRLWLSVAELLLAALQVILRLYVDTHTTFPEALFPSLVLHCAALREGTLWTNAALATDSGGTLNHALFFSH